MRPTRDEVAVLGGGGAGAGAVRLVAAQQAVQLLCQNCQSAILDTRSRAQVVWEQLLQGPLMALQGVLLGDAQRAGKHSRIAKIRDASAAAAFGQQPASLVAQGLKHERCGSPLVKFQPALPCVRRSASRSLRAADSNTWWPASSLTAGPST